MTETNELEISIDCGNHDVELVYNELIETEWSIPGIDFVLLQSGSRSIEAAPELIAVLGLGTGAVSALITGLFQLLSKRAEKSVKISIDHPQSGRIELEFSSGMNEAELLEFTAKLEELQRPTLRLHL
jgi:hypothetical protein